jgi:hypothetical protein
MIDFPIGELLDEDGVLEADELYQNAGGKGEPCTDPDDPPRQ